MAPGAADAHALGVEAAVAEGRGAAGADPLVAALVTAFLLGESLLERRHDLVPRPERLDRRHLLGGEVFFGDQLEPFLGDVGGEVLAGGRDEALEHRAEDLVEAVELALVVNEDAAAEIIELLGIGGDDLGVERLEEQEMLLQAGGNPAAPQRLDKANEHRSPVPPGAREVERRMLIHYIDWGSLRHWRW